MYAILIKVYNKRHTGTYYRAISYVTIDSYTSRRKYSFSITEPGNIMQFGTLQFALRVVEYIKQDSTKGSIILPEILDILIIEHDVAAEYIAYQKELFEFSKKINKTVYFDYLKFKLSDLDQVIESDDGDLIFENPLQQVK